MFGKVKDVDFEILSKLNDRDLGKLRATDKYFRDLCKNDTFWRNRTINRFAKYLGGVEGLQKYFIESKLTTWREYYISIIDFLESKYTKQSRFQKRPDLIKLDKILSENNEILRKQSLEDEKWKEILRWDLIDPNVIIDEYIGNEELRYILSLDDPRIRPYRALDVILQEGAGKSAKILLQDKRIVPENVLQSVEEILRNHDIDIEANNVLDLYLDYIIKAGKAEDLRNRIYVEDEEKDDLHIYIYDYIDSYISSSLPEILKILNSKKFSKLDYDKILARIETLQ